MTFVHFHCEFSTNSLDLEVDREKNTSSTPRENTNLDRSWTRHGWTDTTRLKDAETRAEMYCLKLLRVSLRPKQEEVWLSVKVLTNRQTNIECITSLAKLITNREVLSYGLHLFTSIDVILVGLPVGFHCLQGFPQDLGEIKSTFFNFQISPLGKKQKK